MVGQGTAENSRLQSLALGAEIEHALQQRWIGDVGIASGVFAVLGAFGQHEMIRPADVLSGIPQTKSHARANDGADGEGLRRGEDLARDQVVPRVLVVGGVRMRGKYSIGSTAGLKACVFAFEIHLHLSLSIG